VIGMNTFTVSVEATAGAVDCGAGGAGPGAIFAGGTCGPGKWAVDVSGSTNRVFGGVHSNDDVNVGGGSNDFDDIGSDPFTYVDVLNPDPVGNGNMFDSGYPASTSAKPWPAGYDPSVASLASPANDAYWTAWQDKAIADGHGGGLLTSKISSITSNGVYYTTHPDGMDIGSIDGGVTNITLIARNGPIKVSDSDGDFSPDADANGILALSGEVYGTSENCDKYAVALSGSSTDWNGIIWGPGGMVEFSGSSNSAVNGSLVGWAVRLNGSNIEIRYDSTLFQGDPKVLLLK
jgi:hypothetical protein